MEGYVGVGAPETGSAFQAENNGYNHLTFHYFAVTFQKNPSTWAAKSPETQPEYGSGLAWKE